MVKRKFMSFFGIHRQEPEEDIELAPPAILVPQRPFINGFPSAADFIARDPDCSFSIYNFFPRLAARNILHIEAELFELQKQQDNMDVEDFHGNPDTLQCFRSWKKLAASNEQRQKDRLELIKKIREKLKEYYEALALQETVLKMSKPEHKSVEAAKLWFDGRSEGPNGRRAPTFSGLGATRLNDKNALVALHPPFEKDWLVKLVSLPYLRLLCLDSHIDESIALFSMRKINQAVAIISLVIAALLFIGAIVTLYLVTNSDVRLGLICLFTICFALTIHMLTNARRTELFASTAAYAAVLVVFVSGSLGGNACACSNLGG